MAQEKQEKVLIIGGGQVGGSILLNLQKNSGFDVQVFDQDPATGDYWHEHAPEGTAVENLKQAAAEADIIIFATPIGAFGDIAAEIAPTLKKGCLLTDVGSAKQLAIARIRDALEAAGRDDVYYVPAHPGYGVDGKGPASAKADMYHDREIFLVPPESPDAGQQAAFGKAKAMWQGIFRRAPTEISAAGHDAFFGTTSHLQHAVVFSLTADGASESGIDENYLHAGTYLRNLTRISNHANAPMWLGVFADNRQAVMDSAARFRKHFDSLYDAIETNDRAALLELLHQAHDYRTSMKNDVPRESIWGEIYDIAQEQGSGIHGPGLSAQFNHESITRFTRRVAVPTVLGAALSLNIKQTDSEIVDGISIAEKINPSALDGTAPMLADPEVMADMLLQPSVKTELLAALRRCEERCDETFAAIDHGDKDYLENLIHTADRVRQQMPPPRRAGTQRLEFALIPPS